MKNSTIVIFTTLLGSYSLSLSPMDYKQDLIHDQVRYQTATLHHVKALVDLVNTHAYKDSDKIVIVPERFRESYFESAITGARLFIAAYGEKIIGYKKLFCITDNDELNDIVTHELRCKGTEPVAYGSVSLNDLVTRDISSQEITQLACLPVTYIYTGADFTHPAYRGNGINADLTNHAFDDILEPAIAHIKDQRSTHIALIYGLTHTNAGSQNDLLDGRTHGIIQQFIPFVQKVAQRGHFETPLTLLVSRHAAFKPSFDPRATECIPLSDDHAIPGYGCLIACALVPTAAREDV